jgi:hypothetical protein
MPRCPECPGIRASGHLGVRALNRRDRRFSSKINSCAIVSRIKFLPFFIVNLGYLKKSFIFYQVVMSFIFLFSANFTWSLYQSYIKQK